MFAKLIIYQSGSDYISACSVAKIDRMEESTLGLLATHLADWELTADNLTSGDLIDLLHCVDELGFLDTHAPDPVEKTVKPSA